MKRFEWRLQRVLDVKTKEERVRRAELLSVTEKLAETREQLLVQRMMLKRIMSALAARKAGERVGEQEFALKYSRSDDRRIRQLEQKVEELERHKKEKIKALLKVRRLKEGLQRLRDQAKRKFIYEQEKLEQKQIDEGATIRFARKAQV